MMRGAGRYKQGLRRYEQPRSVRSNGLLEIWRCPSTPDVTMAIPNSDLIAIRRVNINFTTGVSGLVRSQRGEE
jgi:hypothetical protein